MTPVQGSLLAAPVAHPRKPLSLCDRLAEFFKAHPGEWLGARELEFAGRQAWRTRVSELRKAPYFMRIENRVRIVRSSGPLEPGRSRHFKVSEYLYRPSVEAHEAQ